jgi:proteasome lid subunit RPN8/RPN11
MTSKESPVKPGSAFFPPVGTTPPLRLTPAVYAAIRAHGEHDYPQECCGALLGNPTQDGWRVAVAIPACNACTDSAHNRFQIAAAELVKIERQARGLGLQIAGFYHSHPDHPAHWSPYDQAEAHWLGCCYVITSVVQSNAAETSAFLLAGDTEEDKRFEQQAILVGE